MFSNLISLFAVSTFAFGSSLSTDLPTPSLAAPEAMVSAPAPLPTLSARIAFTYAGNGYYNIIISGSASAPNALVGARVYGADSWFDDFLFSMGGAYTRTDAYGNFSFSKMVYRSTLDEDWGEDDIYAIVDVTNAGSGRTNTIHYSF